MDSGGGMLQSAQDFQRILQSAEPAVYLVEPRVLRRVIRMDRNLQGFRLLVPHSFSYSIERDRLLSFVDLSELDLPSSSDLPRIVILMPRPRFDSTPSTDWQRIEADYHRRLFHETIHVEFELLIAKNNLGDEWVAQRRAEIGKIEFAEIREILMKDDYLFPSPTDLEVYLEFVATFLELKYFAPQELRLYFPAIREWRLIDQIIEQDLNHLPLFERLEKIPELFSAGRNQPEQVVQSQVEIPKKLTHLSLAQFRALQAKSERAAATGNSVKSALSHYRAARVAPLGFEEQAISDATAELQVLVQRLQVVLELTDSESEQWFESLKPLLQPASVGFWSNEARLLYDLQKVCLEHERGVFKLDLVDWIRTLGQRSIKRPLPLMQDALTLRHLKTINRRISLAQIDSNERIRLQNLLSKAAPRVEIRSRNRLRKIILQVLDEVGLVPENVPESVARQKILEELLDKVVDKSYFSISDLRDSLSRNQLKLPDVTKFGQLIRGDGLLKADRQFDARLDGVYRPGTIYQRWPQTLSSLFFGTRTGRFVTAQMIVPFGGAYLTIVFLTHLLASFKKMFKPKAVDPDLVAQTSDVAAQAVPAATDGALELSPIPEPIVGPELDVYESHVAAQTVGPSIELILGVLLLGTWVSLMIQRPKFREFNKLMLKKFWVILKGIFYQFPSRLFASEYVQKILKSRGFRVFRDYLLDPAVCILFMWVIAWMCGVVWGWQVMLVLYLATALFLTSPVGRYVSELSTDVLMRAWHELKFNVFYAIVQSIIDLFDRVFVNLERVVYSVDEFLRFRAGDNPISQTIKLAAGVVWFLVSYVVVFVFTLLVEPQINPIKHFPVVTVSHKIILAAAPEAIDFFNPILGPENSKAFVLTFMWLIPGVFGFLVWELKENWRLYAANRRKHLGSESIGHHGETVVQLMRPGFHSGTLPKAFRALRREARKVSHVDPNWVLRKWSAILHVEESVKHFVERELIVLLEQAEVTSGCHWEIAEVSAATNRIDVHLVDHMDETKSARLTWEFNGERVVGILQENGLLTSETDEVLQKLLSAFGGLFQRANVRDVYGDYPIRTRPAYAWNEWVKIWTPDTNLKRIELNTGDESASVLPADSKPV